MEVPEIVTALRQRGMRLWSENGHVVIEPDALTEADVATILASKPAILAYLRSEIMGARSTDANAAPSEPSSKLALAKPATAYQSPTRPKEFDWAWRQVRTLLSSVHKRLWLNHGRTPVICIRIEKLQKIFEPVIATLLNEGDFDSLRYCLIDLQRQVDDALSGFGYESWDSTDPLHREPMRSIFGKSFPDIRSPSTDPNPDPRSKWALEQQQLQPGQHALPMAAQKAEKGLGGRPAQSDDHPKGRIFRK